jgi:hypothetical protein
MVMFSSIAIAVTTKKQYQQFINSLPISVHNYEISACEVCTKAVQSGGHFLRN